MNRTIEDYINVSNEINTKKSEFKQSIKDLTDAQKDYSIEVIAHAKDLLRIITDSSINYFEKDRKIPYKEIVSALGLSFDDAELDISIIIEGITSFDQDSITFYGHCDYLSNWVYGHISIPIDLLKKNLTENDPYLLSVFETVKQDVKKDIDKQNIENRISRLRDEIELLEMELSEFGE